MALRLTGDTFTRLDEKRLSFVDGAVDDAGTDAIKPNEEVEGAANCNRDWRSIVFDDIPNDGLSIIFANGLFLM